MVTERHYPSTQYLLFDKRTVLKLRTVIVTISFYIPRDLS
jgi:hypothetical protein